MVVGRGHPDLGVAYLGIANGSHNWVMTSGNDTVSRITCDMTVRNRHINDSP